jgi:hypothetical protein
MALAVAIFDTVYKKGSVQPDQRSLTLGTQRRELA